jgi:hypothetical protein
MLYLWAYWYYLILTPLLLAKNQGGMGVFLEMPIKKPGRCFG